MTLTIVATRERFPAPRMGLALPATGTDNPQRSQVQRVAPAVAPNRCNERQARSIAVKSNPSREAEESKGVAAANPRKCQKKRPAGNSCQPVITNGALQDLNL